MITFDRQELMQTQEVRQQRKSLKLFRQAFQSQKQHENLSTFSKKKTELQTFMTSMRVNRLKNTFIKKFTLNNIFEKPISFELISQEQENSKRLIKLKGICMPPQVLSLIFLFQMVFLIITFLISSWMAFIPDFTHSKAQKSEIAFTLNVLTFIMSCIHFAIMSISQRIENGILVSYITDILLRYARSLMMVFDLFFIGLLGVLIITRHFESQSIGRFSIFLFICCIARIVYCSKNLTLFRTTFMNSIRMDQYYKLVHLIIFNLLFSHFIATILLAMTAIDTEDNWIIHKGLQNQPWYVHYAWSYYWATTIVMTVGFGDFTASTYNEAFVVAFLQFFSCIVLAYNVSEIGGIISNFRTAQNSFITKIALFKRMTDQNEIENELKNKIESYIREQKTIKQKFEFNEQNELIQTLPEPLRKQYNMSSNGRFFKYLPFFKTLQKATLLKFTQKLTSKVYYPSQLLYKANQWTEQIMILKDGKVGLAFKKFESKLNGIIIEEIQIKEREFMTNEDEQIIKKIPILLTTQFLTPGKIINHDMTALKYSNVFLLSHQYFLQIIKESDFDKEYFFSMIHERSPNGNQWEQLPCESCMQKFQKKGDKNEQKSNDETKQQNNQTDRFYFHTKFNCPRLHYLPLPGLIIYKFLMLSGLPQQRKTNYHKKQQKTRQSCLMLRKHAYKTYEQRKMINQKKLLHKSNSTRMNTEQSDRRFQDILGNKDSYEYLKQPTQTKHLYQEAESFTNDSLYQVNPKDPVRLTFWDIQIDVMANYYNYFPQLNGARLENVELCTNKISKIKVQADGLLKRKNLKLRKKSSKKHQYKQEAGRNKDTRIQTSFTLRMVTHHSLTKQQNKTSVSSIPQIPIMEQVEQQRLNMTPSPFLQQSL